MSFTFRKLIPTNRASKDDNLFAGKSTLRAEEKNKTHADPKDSALQTYLAKKYTCGDSGKDDGAGMKRKKKKQKSAPEVGGAIRIVDEDISGFIIDPSGRSTLTGKRARDEDDEDEEHDAPTIANPEEAAALRQQVEKMKAGSGWVPATEAKARSATAGPWNGTGSPDASPPRRRLRHDSPDGSPSRRNATQNASPPRWVQRRNSPDASPPRRNTIQDASPPRRRQRHDSPDALPPRRDTVQDVSPPRRRQRPDSPDVSPPRRNAVQDASLPRRRQRHDSPDALPPRRDTVQYASPPRWQQPADADPPRVGNMMGPPARMKDGTAAGLVSAKQLAADIQKQREAAVDRRRNAEGRDALTVYRDKATGRVVTAEEARQAQKDQRAARKKPSIYDDDQTLEWRAGLAQKRGVEQRMRELQEEASKPFARSDMETSHDDALRERVRFGDPFAQLAHRKQAKAEDAAAVPLTMRYDVEKLNKSGFNIPQEVPDHSWIKRGVAAPANRYNIRPGRHWDGVNRSNGFEAELFKHQNLRAARELEARLWNMGDM